MFTSATIFGKFFPHSLSPDLSLYSVDKVLSILHFNQSIHSIATLCQMSRGKIFVWVTIKEPPLSAL